MLRKLLAAAAFALLGVAAFAPSAHAQRAKVVPTCGTVSPAYSTVGDGAITIDTNGNQCIAGTFSATGGTVSNAASAQATTGTNQGAVAWLYGFNGTTWDQLQVDASKFLKVNCASGCSGGTFSNSADAVATSSTNGQTAAWGYYFNGTTWDRSRGDVTNGLWANIKASVLPTGAATQTTLALISTGQGSTADAPCSLPATTAACSEIALAKALANNSLTPLPAQSTDVWIGNVKQISQYPAGATPITASNTGTTAATTATLAGTSGKTTYMCTLSARSNATAATQGHVTTTGLTTNFAYPHWVAPVASGIGITEMIYTPCIPASAANTGIAVTSPAAGSGGDNGVNLTGYQL